MEYSNSKLITCTNLSPNYSSGRKTINRITPHHTATGPITAVKIGEIFATTARSASCNYGIGDDGSACLIVDEKNRAWTSSSRVNDEQAITFEISNSAYGEPWAISDKAYAKFIDMAVDICKRYGATEVFNIEKELAGVEYGKRGDFANSYSVPAGKILLTQHNYFSATACPGTYIKQHFDKMCEDINARLNGEIHPDLQGSKKEFIEEIAAYVQKHMAFYGIEVASPIIAQSCLESAYGTSELAKNANNYFGLKYREGRCKTCTGTYEKKGSEQNSDGSYTTSAMTWCKFDSMEGSVLGYFDFISISRYNNLKGVTDPRQYLENIKADGYATSKNYVDNVMSVITKWDLTKYDTQPVTEIDPNTAQPTLKNGSSGAEVKKLQTELNTFGFNLSVDGKFGSGTEKAVKGFQRLTGLEEDGIYGKDSAVMLSSKLKK